MEPEKEHLTFLLIGEPASFALIEQLQQSPIYLAPISKAQHASTLQEALIYLEASSFDLIFLDPLLPDSQGIDAFLTIQKVAEHTPIILLATRGRETLAFDAISLGADDFIFKHETELEIFARHVRNALERHRIKESLQALSFTDELTHIYNRRGFMAFATQQIEMAKRLDRGVFLFLIDLDGLKSINDTFGHHEGDNALIDAAECLMRTFRSTDIVGRIGGDEFAILAINVNEGDEEYLLTQLQMSVDALNAQFNRPYYLSLSVGIAFYLPKEENLSLEELFQIADKILYLAKGTKH